MYESTTANGIPFVYSLSFDNCLLFCLLFTIYDSKKKKKKPWVIMRVNDIQLKLYVDDCIGIYKSMYRIIDFSNIIKYEINKSYNVKQIKYSNPCISDKKKLLLFI